MKLDKLRSRLAQNAVSDGIFDYILRLPLLAASTALAALLRFFQLGRNSFWLDEGSSLVIAQSRYVILAKVISIGEANMALYYVLLHAWLRLGRDEFVVRSLSVLFALATLPVLYALATRLFDRRVGLVAVLLLAVNGAHIQYAQEARSYTLVVFLVTVSSLFFVKSLERPCLKHWCGYILASVLAAYSHFFGMLVLPAQWASLPFMRIHDRTRRQLLISTLVILVLLAPLGIFILTRDSGQLDWIPRTTPQGAVGLLYLLAGALFGSKLLLALYLASVSTAIIRFGARWRGTPSEAGSYGLLLTGVLIPIMLTFAISYFKPIFVDRYLLICLPCFVLLTAAGLCRVRPKWLFAAMLIALVALSLRADDLYYRNVRKEDWRDAARYVLSRAQSGDALIVYAGEARFPFDYYRERAGRDYGSPVVVFPCWDSCFQIGNTYAGGRDVIGPSRLLLAGLTSRYRRVWLILNHDGIAQLGRDKESQLVRASLAGEYSSVIDRRFFGVDVLLYSADNAERANGHQLTQRLPQHHEAPAMLPTSKKTTKVVVRHVGAT